MQSTWLSGYWSFARKVVIILYSFIFGRWLSSGFFSQFSVSFIAFIVVYLILFGFLIDYFCFHYCFVWIIMCVWILETEWRLSCAIGPILLVQSKALSALCLLFYLTNLIHLWNMCFPVFTIRYQLQLCGSEGWMALIKKYSQYIFNTCSNSFLYGRNLLQCFILLTMLIIVIVS